ncbi:hypothetical protein COCON_G00056120 [Conger conger]|uniref:Uncharacterized protein n=1 Tax=Conger conger TaxID=82655 RepID=A0A9Q1I654_CONCO|nr:hypothetical protein COCON_G00056120 [Conger conger]
MSPSPTKGGGSGSKCGSPDQDRQDADLSKDLASPDKLGRDAGEREEMSSDPIPETGPEQRADHTEMEAASTGGWKPVPFLADGKAKAGSAPSKAPVDTPKSSSPQRVPDEKCFTSEVPSTSLDSPELTAHATAPADNQSEPCATISRSRSASPQTEEEGHSQVVPTGVNTDMPAVSPNEHRSSRSCSPAKLDGDHSRSPSPSKPAVGQDFESPSVGKNEKPIKRRSSSSPARKKSSKSRSPSRRRKSRTRSPARRKRSPSNSSSPRKVRRRRSKSAEKSKRSKSRSPARKRRSRSRSRVRRSRSRRSRSSSRRRRSGFPLDRRDRWRRTPSHSPILILRKRRSTSRTRRSASKTPPRLTELDKDQLLEIAKANAAAMCAKAGVPIPESLRPKAILQLPLPTPVPTPLSLPLPLPMNLPMNLPLNMSNMSMPNMNMPNMGMPNMNMPNMNMPNMNMTMPSMSMTAAVATMTAALSTMSALSQMPNLPALPTITNKPPPMAIPNTANIEEVKRKVTQKANSISIKELTEKCKKIAESKEEMAIAKPHVSDDEDDNPRDNKGSSFSLS